MYRRRMALLLLLLLPAAFAVSPIDLTFAWPLMAIFVAIFLALASMLSHAIADPRLEAWVKTELRELFAAFILIIVISAFFISSNGISIALTGKSDYIQESQDIMDKWLDRYDNAYEYVIKAATRIRVAATYSPWMSIPIWYLSINYSTNPLSGIAILLGTLNLATQGLMNATFLAEGIRLLITFVNATVPKILLPLAFMVRLIPFTRRLGNTLIAISLAAVVFLPFSIILADTLNQAITMPHPSMDLNELDADPWAMTITEPFCESMPLRVLFGMNELGFGAIVCLPLLFTPWTIPLYEPCVMVIIPDVVYPLISTVYQLAHSLLLLIWEGIYLNAGPSYADSVFDQVQPFLRDVNNLVLVGYLDFILIGIVTIVGARSLSSALGGEWYMAGIQRLI